MTSRSWSSAKFMSELAVLIIRPPISAQNPWRLCAVPYGKRTAARVWCRLRIGFSINYQGKL
jgi:hypothetical protein